MSYAPMTREVEGQVVLNTREFARFLAKEHKIPISQAITALELIRIALMRAMGKGYAVRWIGLGTFQIREQKPRLRFNPHSKKRMQVPASTRVQIRISKSLMSQIRKEAAKNLEDLEYTPIIDTDKRKSRQRA